MITQDRLRELFSYDPDTGILTRKTKRGHQTEGSIAGTKRKDGRIAVYVDYKVCLGHRLIFLMVHGFLPEEVDHINGNPSDNRICNLREATHSENQQNRRSAPKHSKSGILGAKQNKRGGRWISEIRHCGKTIYIGSFDTPEEAHAAYVKTKREIHKGCTL